VFVQYYNIQKHHILKYKEMYHTTNTSVDPESFFTVLHDGNRKIVTGYSLQLLYDIKYGSNNTSKHGIIVDLSLRRVLWYYRGIVQIVLV